MRLPHPIRIPRTTTTTTTRLPARLSTTRPAHVRPLSARTLQRLPAIYYRGGTSRALIFRATDLPSDRTAWGPIFLGTIGSPDSHGRQLDGMGGGLSSLSKVCIVAPGDAAKDVDVEYTFVALGVQTDEVDYSSNCGNMSSAIGPYALQTGLVPCPQEDGKTTVRILNTNTNKIIHATFPALNGELAVDGDFSIDGVAGTAARIELAFLDPAGSRTGRLLPTGNAVDEIDGVHASLVDCGNPCCFVDAEELGIDGTILPEAMEADEALLRRLDGIRREASVMMGLSGDTASAAGSVPKIAVVSRSRQYTATSGEVIAAEKVNLCVRAMSVGQPHRAVPITVAMAIAAAADVRGSIVNQLASKEKIDAEGLVLGHPSGKIVVGTKYDDKNKLASATVHRTARCLFDGNVYWRS